MGVLGDHGGDFVADRKRIGRDGPGVGVVFAQPHLVVTGDGDGPGVLTGSFAAAGGVVEGTEVAGDALDGIDRELIGVIFVVLA
ncbi:hypothetical protein [Saccharopolyspora pogona]|uniref:hypothetical protein n=1 Tax=Saccharopolyspora pogona TaxID=333966 RepID=UPI0016894026|nr:hypothetical protein [Saccharopolyspora pogona]